MAIAGLRGAQGQHVARKQGNARKYPIAPPSPNAPLARPSAPASGVRQIQVWLGIAVVLGSLLLGLATVSNMLEREAGVEIGALGIVIVFFVGTTAAGAFLAVDGQRRREQTAYGLDEALAAPPLSAEACILQLASTRRARVTVAEVAAHCGLTLERSKVELDRLAVTGAALLEVTPDGVLVYSIPGFLSDKEKEAAGGF